MAEKKAKKKMSTGKKVAIGATVAAVGAAAYYFLGPKGKQNQKKAKDWAVKMEKNIESKVKPMIKKGKKTLKVVKKEVSDMKKMAKSMTKKIKK
jgi:gas vesicle protein